MWRALAAADSDVYIVRGGSPALGIAALFCRIRRRRLVFSSAIDGDFTLETLGGRRHMVALYRAGLESASAIVVQSEQQIELATRTLRGVPGSSASRASARTRRSRHGLGPRRRRSSGSAG